ncbi:putative transcription factor/ chromatin remodeling BED-type(Zn) family [Helianthus annuus]|uniref:Transcription factor/ chromatin remodeling BED-type(Zn) family n=2 Tax=Helianthus annuus TaxID=4232 RepID=A0A9K3N940_HELAN|nr:uncharacterized protein LOC110895177 isoform X1 [Helianthus annuus]XP_021998147.1 uncharacterized protein LOC110895177 isoform X1 [Helianthus annuus]XP_021998148.1 uncharacterized protein LOC110895177 isoform X1 [Helianthus annuus]KAF5791586.1 putative transcription factor/ chromatin remodeling BED-type(Zn) family [Helianthus annuus]KAJ0535132.1 putative transcription factor/ chromatin remodeling BED-type(Zn) family [Helianthus annuus]KAJ0543022.1 putative transcription factor/ chromatin re
MASMESTASKVLKRKSNDIGWEYGSLVDPNKLDRTQCDLCKKTMSGGIYRLKQHIAGIPGSVTVCPKATKDDQLRVRNALNEAQNKKKAKQSGDEALRSEVNIGDETIDLDDCLGDLKESRSFGPINRFGTSQGKNKNAYEPILDIISKKSSKRLDTCLHMTAYILNPYYFYNNSEVRDDLEANDAVVECVGVLFPKNYDMQSLILSVELPIYKRKQEKFDRPIALKACEINNENFDPEPCKAEI